MPVKSFYFSKSDQQTIDEAIEKAEEIDTNLSTVIVRLLHDWTADQLSYRYEDPKSYQPLWRIEK